MANIVELWIVIVSAKNKSYPSVDPVGSM